MGRRWEGGYLWVNCQPIKISLQFWLALLTVLAILAFLLFSNSICLAIASTQLCELVFFCFPTKNFHLIFFIVSFSGGTSDCWERMRSVNLEPDWWQHQLPVTIPLFCFSDSPVDSLDIALIYPPPFLTQLSKCPGRRKRLKLTHSSLETIFNFLPHGEMNRQRAVNAQIQAAPALSLTGELQLKYEQLNLAWQ